MRHISPEVFYKKAVTLSSFLAACNFTKKVLQHRCFPVNFRDISAQLLS